MPPTGDRRKPPINEFVGDANYTSFSVSDDARKTVFGFFRRRRSFDDHDNDRFVDAISTMLEAQLIPVGGRTVEDSTGNINPKALGYIYGFIDAALRTIGQDMADESIGIPISFQILARVFPGREEKYLEYLIERMGNDQIVTMAAITGGQQYMDFNNATLAAPTGLARFILEQEE